MNKKIFVINLKRCPEKREIMVRRLKKHASNFDVTFIEAVDGNELTNQNLKEKNISLVKDYRDPYSGRNMTWGEVGCTLSHFKVYDRCIKENIDIAIIFEDDIMIPPLFEEKLNDTLTRLKEMDWEFCYLGRKPIEKDTEFNDIFVKPGYSYWTCGYIINLKGIKKIKEVNKKIIPIDEFLPIVGNISPLTKYEWFSTSSFLLDEPLKMFSLKKLLIKPTPLAFNKSDTENSKEVDFVSDDLLLLATGTEMTDGLKRFMNSCKVYGLKFKIMGLGEKWIGGNMTDGPGGGQKINFLINTLKEIGDERLILVTDSYDVIMSANSKEIVKKFKKFNCPIVFAAEASCWPDTKLAEKYPPTESPNKYLNSGGFIGKAKDIKKILPSAAFEANSDDQLYYTNKYLSQAQDGEKLIKLDYKCDIFQCLNNAENEIEILYGKSRLKNKLFDTEPCQIHGNGPPSRKHYLNKLESYLMKNWTNIWGYNKKNVLMKLPGEIKLMIYIEANAETCDIYEDLLSLIDKNVKIIEESTTLTLSCYSSNKNMKTKKANNTAIKANTNEKLRNKALKTAKNENVDYLWVIDSNYVITEANTLKNMILQNKGIVGPLMHKKTQLWSCFWGAVDKNGWYKDAFDYKDIVNGNRKGCWNIPHLQGNYLINKETIQKVQNFYTNDYNKNYSIDMKFSKNCRDNNIFLYVENLKNYGYIFEGIKDEIPPNAIHKSFYLFETDRVAWANKYLHPNFLFNIKNLDKLKVNEICKFAFEFPFVNDVFCDHLLDEVNNINEWSPGGHKKIKDKRISGVENIPTVDIHMSQIGFRKQWDAIIKAYIAPLVSYLYSPFKTTGLNIGFVVKYEMGGQQHLSPHHDSASYSLVITLNRPNIDFEGGGTRFVKQNVMTQGKKGYCTLHPGRLTHYHEGLPITKGKRFIMVSFVN